MMQMPGSKKLASLFKQQSSNGKQRKKISLKLKFLVLLFSVFLSVAILEIFVRVFRVSGMTMVPQYFYSKDDLLGYKLSKNFDGVTRTKEFNVDISTNSEGFRDYEHTKQKAIGTYRIVGLGDSFTFGFGVAFEESYLTILERKMNLSFSGQKQVEIIKMGIPGYCFLQEFLLFKEEGIDYDPDLVLVGFDINDHIDSIEPFDTVCSGFLIRRNSLKSPFLKERIFVYKNLQSIYILSNVTTAIKNRLVRNKEAKILSDNELRQQYKDKALQLTGKLLKDMKQLCEQRNIKMCVIFIPHRSQVHPDKFKPPMLSYYFNDLDLFMGGECKKNRIAYVNLLPAFKRSAGKGEQLYFNIDGHWNSDGHKLAAELIYEKLREFEIVHKIKPAAKTREQKYSRIYGKNAGLFGY